MDKDLARYINILLAEKQREVKSKQNYLDKIHGMPAELIDTVTGERTPLDPERHFAEFQEIEWEQGMIIKAQRAMDTIIEEDI